MEVYYSLVPHNLDVHTPINGIHFIRLRDIREMDLLWGIFAMSCNSSAFSDWQVHRA